MVTGIVTIAGDVGIVALSAIIPDPIEPELIKTKADETFEGYKDVAIQLIQNPMSVLELAAQSVSDTVEAEGIAYVTGGALTALIPASFGVKVVKGGAGIKGPGKAKVKDRKGEKENSTSKISETDRAKLENWERPPSEELYLAHKKTYDNPIYFDQETGRIIYPGTKDKEGYQHIRGFLNGKSNKEPLKPETIIDRYGDNNNGQYFSPDGSSYESRALPPFMKDKPYERYRVVKEFEVDAGTVAPWFDEKGLGTQYYTNYKIKDRDGKLYEADVYHLEQLGYIKLLKKEE